MAEAVKGINRIMLMRPYSLRENEAAGRLAFQISHEKSSSRDSNSTITKDGNIQSLSEEVVEYSLSTLMARDDEVRVKLEEAYHDGGLVEFWDIDKTAAETEGTNNGKYSARYYQGYLTEWSESAGAEDTVEISINAAMNGIGVSGHVSLTENQAQVVQYEFADTNKTGTGA